MAENSWKGAGRAYLRPQKGGGSACQVCRGLNLHNDNVARQVIRIDVFDLAESADEGDCRWCSLIYRSMMELGAQLPGPGSSCFVRIIAQKGSPVYVEWLGQHGRIAGEIYQAAGKHNRILQSLKLLLKRRRRLCGYSRARMCNRYRSGHEI